MERKNYVYQNSNQQNVGQYYRNDQSGQSPQVQPKRTLMSYVPQRRTPAIISPPRQYNRQNSIQASSYASPGPQGHSNLGQSVHGHHVTQSPQIQPTVPIMSQTPQSQGTRQHVQMAQGQQVVLSTPQGLSGRIIQERGMNFLETQDGQRIELRASSQQQIQPTNQMPGNNSGRPNSTLNQYSFSESKQQQSAGFVQQQQQQSRNQQFQQQNVQKHYFPIGLPQVQSVQSIQQNQQSNVQYRKINQHQPRITQIQRSIVYQSNPHLGKLQW